MFMGTKILVPLQGRFEYPYLLASKSSMSKIYHVVAQNRWQRPLTLVVHTSLNHFDSKMIFPPIQRFLHGMWTQMVSKIDILYLL